MRKITKIDFLEPFKLLCHFDNGEMRIFDLEKSLLGPKRFSEKILNDETYKLAKVGHSGEIYWENMAEMKDLDGKIILCEYDIDPDYAYMESIPMEMIGS